MSTLDQAGTAQVVGHKSWLAYCATLVLAALLFFVALPLAFRWGDLAAAVVLALAALLVAYRLASSRSVVLYYDDAGVWVYRGVLPWRRRVVGLPWGEVGQASFEPGFWSWVTRSWTVQVSHRHSRVNVIFLTHIGGGKRAVATLNGRHQQWLQAHGQLDD